MKNYKLMQNRNILNKTMKGGNLEIGANYSFVIWGLNELDWLHEFVYR